MPPPYLAKFLCLLCLDYLVVIVLLLKSKLKSVRFGKCEICWNLSNQINDKSLSLEVKLGSIKAYRDHLHAQYIDRSIQWSLMDLSRDDTSGTVIVLVDGMDQAKFRVPKHPGLRAVSSMFLVLNCKFVAFSFLCLLVLVLENVVLRNANSAQGKCCPTSLETTWSLGSGWHWQNW